MNTTNLPTPSTLSQAERVADLPAEPESGLYLQERFTGVEPGSAKVPVGLWIEITVERVLAERQSCACGDPIPCALFVP